MKRKFFLFTMLSAATIMISSCGGGDAKKTSDDNTSVTTTEKEATGKSLVDAPSAPSGVIFAPQDFEGMGTMQLPSGTDWEQDGKSRYNEKLDMTVITNVQNEGMTDVREEYVQSYIDNNHRDAPNFKLSNREAGTINNVAANRVTGSFNNGTEYVTRDYLFFTNDKSGILQVRIAKKNEDKLQPITDYMAASFTKK